jgi:hypothetical protein
LARLRTLIGAMEDLLLLLRAQAEALGDAVGAGSEPPSASAD